MTKMDAKFYGEIRKVKDDSIVPDDQYVVFLVKDNAFAAILPIYLEKCLEMGAANPDKLKVPDARGEKLLA